MVKLKNGLCAAVAAFSVAVGGMTSASAASFQMPMVSVADSGVQQIRRGRNDRVRMRKGRPYYRGHRGYRGHRRGYRYYDGFWFPAAAFIGGVIIGNAFNYPRPAHRYNDWYRLHVQWCDARYRSYRVSDDTFQPYHGPRRRCNSPYDPY